jgi:hypothetical protein
MQTNTHNEYSIAFIGNITIFAKSEAEARRLFFEEKDLGSWAEIDQVQVQQFDIPDSDISETDNYQIAFTLHGTGTRVLITQTCEGSWSVHVGNSSTHGFKDKQTACAWFNKTYSPGTPYGAVGG